MRDPVKLGPKPAGGTILRADRGGMVASPDGRASVSLEPGALLADARIVVKRVPAYTPPKSRRLIGAVYDFSAEHPASGARLGSFRKGVTISFAYRLEDLGGSPESSLAIYYFNERTSAWEAVPSKLDRRGRVATATVDHLSQYSLQGQWIDPTQPSFSTIPNHDFQISAISLAEGPENADFGTASYLPTPQPSNPGFDSTPTAVPTTVPNGDFESGSSQWTVSGGAVETNSGSRVSGSAYAHITSGGGYFTSAAFTVPSEAQIVEFYGYSDQEWAGPYGNAQVFVDSGTAPTPTPTTIYLERGPSWNRYSINVAPYRGYSVKIKFTASDITDMRADDVRLRQVVPSWETAANDPLLLEGGPYGSYVQLTEPYRTLTSSAFTVPQDAQTLSFQGWSQQEWAGPYSSAELSVYQGAAPTPTSTTLYMNGGPSWNQYSINVSDYRGYSVKIKFTTPNVTDMRVDEVRLHRIVPNWETTANDPLLLGGGPYGNYVKLTEPYRTLISSAFTIPQDAQTLRFQGWSDRELAGPYSSAELFVSEVSNPTPTPAPTTIEMTRGASWNQYSMNVSAYRGYSVKIKFTTPNITDMRVDEVRLHRIVPNWETTANDPLLLEGGPYGSYVKLAEPYRTLTSSAFTVPQDAQTLRFQGWGDNEWGGPYSSAELSVYQGTAPTPIPTTLYMNGG